MPWYTAWWADNYSKIKVAQYPLKIHFYFLDYLGIVGMDFERILRQLYFIVILSTSYCGIWVLLNTLLQFHKFFLILCIFVVFNNVNTVRSEMWVWGFPNHSCQKFFTNHSSSTRDLTRFLAFVIWKTHCNIGKNKSLQCIEQDILWYLGT